MTVGVRRRLTDAVRHPQTALEDWLSGAIPSRRLRTDLVDQRLRGFAAGAPIRILDAGCGDGLLALELARRHPSWTVVGVDVREDLLSRGRARAGSGGIESARFVAGRVDAPLDAGTFDAVLAIECLAEIEDDRGAVMHLAACLDRDGMLVVHVPQRSWEPVLAGSAPIWRDEVRHGYDHAQLRGLLAGTGLEITDIRGTYRTLACTAQEVRDRLKTAPLVVRATCGPLLLGVARLEPRGIAVGRARGLMLCARRPAGGSGGASW